MKFDPTFSLRCIILWIPVLVSFIDCNDGSKVVSPERRIVDGQPASPDEFPHQVFVKYPVGDSISICGGSIISPSHVLIAAHCVDNVQPSIIEVYAGILDISPIIENKGKGGPVPTMTAETFIHPCYNPSLADAGHLHFNDIAIIKLAKPLTLDGKSIKEIEVDYDDDLAKDDTDSVVVGWGSRGHGHTHSPILQKATLAVNTPFCINADTPPDHFITKFDDKSQVCAYSQVEFVCHGDSGGPLLCDKPQGVYRVCGVSSLSLRDESNDPCTGPGIFTRVFHYRDWIKAVLGGAKDSEAGCIGSKFVRPGAAAAAGLGSLSPRIDGICFILSIFSTCSKFY